MDFASEGPIDGYATCKKYEYMAAHACGGALAVFEFPLEICGAMERFGLWHDGPACTTNCAA